MTVEELCAKLETVRAHDASFVPKRMTSAPVTNSLELVSAVDPIVHTCTSPQPLGQPRV